MRLPLNNIRTVLKVYLLGIAAFTLFRVILVAGQAAGFAEIPPDERALILLRVFVMGWRFDTVISGYILLLPALVLSVIQWTRKPFRAVNFAVFIFLFILYSLSFIICAADIPYFNHYFARFTISAFQWVDSPLFVIRMIFGEPRYWLVLIPFLAVLALFWFLLKRIFRNNRPVDTAASAAGTTGNIILSFIMLGLIFLGIRGRIEEKSPIRVGTAYFSEYAVANLSGLNPVFTLGRSWLDLRKEGSRSLHLMDDGTAIANVQKYLGFVPINDSFPIARKVSPDILKPRHRFNVIVVIMEAMSAGKMGRFGNPYHLTPVLDSLAGNGFSFDNVYSAGIHTFNGLFGTLFSYPALFRQHPLEGTPILKYNGMAFTLKEQGYSTLYFTTHDGQFDNVEGFMKANGVSTVISARDYPSDKEFSTLGVPDDFMFGYSVPVLNAAHSKGKPFFATFLTASDHGPYIIPPWYKPAPGPVERQIVQYADWSIGQFLKKARKQPWFDSTLFVFVADHGAAMNPVYNMPLDFNHVPLIFYSPALIPQGRSFGGPGGQIDLFPTAMGILNLPYVNNSLGVDLVKQQRPFIFFCADDKYGVISDSLFLVVEDNGRRTLHRYRNNDPADYLSDFSGIAKEMALYAESSMQAAQAVIRGYRQFYPIKSTD